MIGTLSLSIYLIIGAVLSYRMITDIDGMIEKSEKQKELDEGESKILNGLSDLNNKTNSKIAFYCIVIFNVLFWLPALISVTISKNKTK